MQYLSTPSTDAKKKTYSYGHTVKYLLFTGNTGHRHQINLKFYNIPEEIYTA
jgi:hypothetical protein